jgi:UDP-glucose 4-epimerase
MAVFLVTGGAGFVGSTLVDNLVARGETVRVIDNFSTGRLSNLAAVQEQVELFSADVGDRDALTRALQGVECVFHFAAPASEAFEDISGADESWTRNVDTLSVLTAARKAGVRRLVYASSGNVYTHRDALQVTESDPILPLSPYGFTKLTGEHQCIAFASLFGLESVRLRYFNVFGPRQSPGSPHATSIPAIVKALLAGQSPVLLGNAYEFHDFLYVDDAAHAAILAAEVGRASGKAYNIARGRSENYLGVVTSVNEILGTHIPPIYTAAKASDFPAQRVSIVKAEVDLGFCPRADLKQGLKALVDYYSKQTDLRRTDRGTDQKGHGPHWLNKDHCKPNP